MAQANMIENVILIIRNDSTSNWATSDVVLQRGELAIEYTADGTPKFKVGDGTKTFAQLSYATVTPAEVQATINAANHSHDNKSILDNIEEALTTTLKSNYDSAYTHSIANHAPADAEKNAIQSILVNGTLVSPDVNRAVDITIKNDEYSLSTEVGAAGSLNEGKLLLTIKNDKTGANAVSNTIVISPTGGLSFADDGDGHISMSAPNAYNDTALSQSIADNTAAISTLNGDADTTGSVAKKVKDASDAINTTLGALADVNLEDAPASFVDAINAALAAIEVGGTGSVVTFSEAETANIGASKTYVLKQGGTQIGTFDIPLDMVIKKGSVVEATPEAPINNKTEGIFIKLEIANSNGDILYIDVTRLIDIYTVAQNATQVQLAIVNNEISASLVNGGINDSALFADGVVTKVKLSQSVQSSLDKADSAIQGVKINGVALTKDANNNVNIENFNTDLLVAGNKTLILNGGGATTSTPSTNE